MLQIDHVTVAWSDLEVLMDEFASLGLPPDYGGVHGNGVTHMAVLGFDDGSYIELISTVEPDGRSPLWTQHIAEDGGPASWAIGVDDAAVTAKRAIDAGLPVNGPRSMTRERPDGTRLEWDLAFVDGYGETLPFVISDRTPREYRVQPSENVTDGPLAGIAEVVIGVDTIDPDPFRRLHRFPTPVRTEYDPWPATLASFPGQPVTLATPTGPGRLADRIDRLGASPCAFLLEANDFATAQEVYPLGAPTEWIGRRVAWFESDRLNTALGVIDDQ